MCHSYLFTAVTLAASDITEPYVCCLVKTISEWPLQNIKSVFVSLANIHPFNIAPWHVHLVAHQGHYMQ